jgi:hypothetical protein
MAGSTIPRERRKDLAAIYAAKNLTIAFFTEMAAYDPLTATTFTAVQAICTEVFSSGTGYSTGGYSLTGKTSSYLSTNGAIMTANPTSVATATFSARYAVIYDKTTNKIEAVQDWLATFVVTNGTITVTPSVDGIINIQ